MTRQASSLGKRRPAPAEPADYHVRELMAVREIAQAFLTAERPEEVYQLALDRVGPLVGATLGCVYLIDPGTDLMRLAAVHNWPARYGRFLSTLRIRVGSGPSGEAASERRVVEVTDVFADPSLAEWQEVAKELEFRSFVALPLATSKSVIGTITFYFGSSTAASAEALHLMRTVADQLAATAEKAGLINDLRATNAALTDSNAKLERQFADLLEARRIKDEFLANISHELRTPLTAVIGYISVMQEGLVGPINPEQQNALSQVKDSSEQLLVLIGDLLELTALKRGSVEPISEMLDPRQPLREAIAAAKGKRTAVALDVEEPDIVPMMRSDGRAIARALKAVLENAYKFTKSGSVRASVDVREDRVVYSITDTGIGIPESAQPVIFDEFRQADGTLTREYGGAGLGLALGRRLAHLVKGDIVLSESSPEGSTFRVEVPLHVDAPPS